MKSRKDFHLQQSRSLLDFINRSFTPFHAVRELGNLLKKSKFVQVKEEDEWNLTSGGKYYVTRNGSSLLIRVFQEFFKPES